MRPPTSARRPPPRPWLLCLLYPLCLTTSGCAHGTAATPRPPLEAALRSADGEPMMLSQLRGQPVLLFLFSTFDEASQLALGRLLEARRELDGLLVIGVALQPNPAPFLDSYGAALAVDFPLLFEPQAHIVSGRSALGGPISVPTLVLLDARGHPVEEFVGVPEVDDILEMGRDSKR